MSRAGIERAIAKKLKPEKFISSYDNRDYRYYGGGLYRYSQTSNKTNDSMMIYIGDYNQRQKDGFLRKDIVEFKNITKKKLKTKDALVTLFKKWEQIVIDVYSNHDAYIYKDSVPFKYNDTTYGTRQKNYKMEIFYSLKKDIIKDDNGFVINDCIGQDINADDLVAIADGGNFSFGKVKGRNASGKAIILDVIWPESRKNWSIRKTERLMKINDTQLQMLIMTQLAQTP